MGLAREMHIMNINKEKEQERENCIHSEMAAKAWVMVSFKASNCYYNKLSPPKQKAIITQNLAAIPGIAGSCA